jgi:hypothetical protein
LESARVIQLLDKAVGQSKALPSFRVRLPTRLCPLRKKRGLCRFMGRQETMGAA